MATVKKNTSADNAVSINQGNSGTTNISVGGKTTINGTEHECIGGTKFYPKGEYYKMENMKNTIANQAHYIRSIEQEQEEWSKQEQQQAMQQKTMPQQTVPQQGTYANPPPLQRPWDTMASYEDLRRRYGGYYSPWGANPPPPTAAVIEKKTYDDWIKHLNKPESIPNLNDELIDTMESAVREIRESVRLIESKLIDLVKREKAIKPSERRNLIKKRELEAIEKGFVRRRKRLNKSEKQLQHLELELVKREAVIEEWEKLHATPNTTSGEPTDVRKRASRL